MYRTKVFFLAAILLLLTAGCAGSGSTPPTGNPGETRPKATTEAAHDKPKTTGESTSEASQKQDVRLKQLSSGAMGPERRQIIIASSARNLAAATGLEIPDKGAGAYAAISWGEKPTGGYTVDFVSASVEGTRVTVIVELKNPPPDAMVAQVLTYPYATAVLPGVDPGEREFVFVTQNGREIGWPIRSG